MTPKVFVVGFHKTGTSSLSKALEILGYDVAGPNPELLQALRARDLQPILRVTDRYDAFQDDPWFLLYEDLYARYPDARFILTERAPDRWLRSVQKHFRNAVNPIRRFIYGRSGAIDAPDRYKKIYCDHNANVRAFFANAGGSHFMVFDVECGDGWETLCRFLDKPVPRTVVSRRILPFPHANPASARRFIRRHRRLKRVKRAAKRLAGNYLDPDVLRKVRRVRDRVLYRFKF